jgi:methylmalonyl-CoA mutase cobalamin-binding subunit
MAMMAKRQAAQIAKGIGIGAAVGGAMGLVGGAMAKPQYQRTAKKGFDKALKAFSNVLEAIS